MNKPAGYDDAKAVEGGFRSPVPGPAIFKIKKAGENMGNGGLQLVLGLDIAKGDLAGFYERQTQKFLKDRYQSVYQNVDGKGTPYFKGIIHSIEKSNPGFVYSFDNTKLVGKLVGGNLRNEEYIRQSGPEAGQIGTVLKIAYLCSIQSVKAGEHVVMQTKKLKQESGFAQPLPDHENGPAHNDEDLPF